MSASKDLTTFSLGYTSIGCTKIPETIWMTELQRMVSVNLGGKNLYVCLPNATTHCPENSGKYLSQPSQWSSTVYELGSGIPRGWLFLSQSSCNVPNPLKMTNIFARAYNFDSTFGIVGRLEYLWKTLLTCLQYSCGDIAGYKANICRNPLSGARRFTSLEVEFQEGDCFWASHPATFPIR